MRNRLLKYALVALLVLKAGLVEAKLFNATEYKLDNGLQVVVLPNHKAPIVKHMVWYKTGSVDEQPGKGGTAHLLEHLMFRGTKKIGKTELNRIMENNGMENNAFTAQDYTAYHQLLDVSKLELAMALEADRMQNLAFSDADFALERDIVYQERKQVVENNMASVFAETMYKVLWQDHPYAKPITGVPEEILGLKPADVWDFYKKFYTPSNAIVVISGDIEPEMALRLAKKYYGGIKSSQEKIAHREFPALKDDFSTRLEMELPNINAERMTYAWLAPSINVNSQEIYSLAILSKYLGEGKISKLYKKLVEEKKLALSVESSYDYMSRSYGSFSIRLVPQQNVSAEQVQKALDEVISEALADLSLDEVEKTKNRMLSGLVYLKDNPGDAAMIVGSMMGAGMPLSEIEGYADKIAQVDYKDVKKAGQKLFSRKARTLGILKPQSEGDK